MGPRPSPTDVGDLSSLLYLQRTAGNAAVASLMAQRRSATPTVQRCGGGACNCSAEEREVHEDGVPVQRGVLDTLEGAATLLLPDSIKSVITGSTGHANATAGELRERGAAVSEQAKSQGAAALEHSSASAEAATSQGEGQMRSHSERAQSVSTETIKTGTVDTAKGEAATAGLDSIGALAHPLMNPAGPMVGLPMFQQAVGHVESVFEAIPGGAADLGSDLKAAVTDGLKAGQSDGWNCDQAEIMAIAGGVERAVANSAVKAGKKVLGEERYEELESWANGRIDDLKAVGATIRGKFEAAKKALQDFWTTHIAPQIQKIQGVMDDLGKLKDKLVAWASGELEKARKLAQDIWASVKTSVIDPVVAFAHTAKEAMTKLVADARTAIGKWWDHLPKLAQDAIIGAGAVIAAPFTLAIAGAEKAEEVLASLAETLGRRLKQLSDGLLQVVAALYQGLRQKVTSAVATFKKKWDAIKARASAALAAAYAKVDGASGGRIASLMAGLSAMKHKITGKVCTVLGDVAGPCIDQFVPNPGKGEEADVTLTTNADVTVPVYDVPVKVGRGATLKLSRKDRKYTATETGEGLIAVTLPKGEGGGGGSFSADVYGPLGAGGAWKSLTGKDAAAAAAPAAGGSSAAPEAKKEDGAEVEAEAGYKGTVDMAYAFDASAGKDTTCDGLGGLTAMLGAQGLGSALPLPFSAVAGGSVTASYAENLTSCIVALLQYGNASVNLKQEGVGGLEAAIKSQSKVAVEHTKDEKEGWIDSASLSQSLGVSGAGKLATSGELPLNLAGEAGVTATMFAKLKYAETTGAITALGAGAKLALSLDLDPGKIKSVLPAAVALRVLAQVTPYIRAGDPGSLEVEASYEVTDLQNLISSVDTYLNETPASAVTTEGLFKVVTDYMASARIEQKLEVKLSTTHSLAKASAEGEAKEVGGKVSLELMEHHAKTIYAYPAGGEGSE